VRTLLLLAVAAVLLAPSVVGAQEAPASKEDSTALSGVTVEARTGLDLQKNYPSVVEKFVQSQEADGPHGNLTRWTTGLCPAVEGLSPQLDAFIYHHLLAVADEVGVPKPKPRGCVHTNVLVLFTTQPQKVMDDVREHHPLLLGYHYPSDTKGLAAFQPPMRSWYVTDTRTWAQTQIDDPDHPAPTAPTGRIKNGMTSEFMFALVVVDPSVLEGQPIGRIADDIAEHVLSNPGARRGCAALPSILDSLDMACPASDTVEQLTDYDRALLKGLYHSEAETQVNFQRGEVLRRILRDTRPPGSGARN
jgi:hypothetical protein